MLVYTPVNYSQDYEETKKALQQLDERLCSIDAKLEDLFTVWETWIKNLDRMTTYRELRYSKLDPSLSHPMWKKWHMLSPQNLIDMALPICCHNNLN